MLKSLLILTALTAGLLLPGLSVLTPTIRPFLMTLLFFSFLGVKLDKQIFRLPQLYAALILPLMGLGAYYAGALYSTELGITMLLMGIAPTAVITPVLATIMKKDAGYTVGGIILTHAGMAIAVPLLLPSLLGFVPSWEDLGSLFLNITGTVFIPLALSQTVKAISGKLTARLLTIAPWAFGLFLSNVAVAAANLAIYVRGAADVGGTYILITSGAMGGLMLVCFGVGAWLAPAGYAVEGSLTSGRKNTMLSIWIALEFINPLAVLGPMLYILLQNIFVSGQIVYVERRGSIARVTDDPSAI